MSVKSEPPGAFEEVATRAEVSNALALMRKFHTHSSNVYSRGRRESTLRARLPDSEVRLKSRASTA